MLSGIENDKNFNDYKMPTYEQDCECLAICKELGGTYKMCYATSIILNKRCSIEARQLLLQRDKQKPSKVAKAISTVERTTLWAIAVGSLIACPLGRRVGLLAFLR
ncbi:MAG: hypothetical protein FWG64_13030 [Firmicutes bacterium]|nr:hypothetical protein [Bacillota bacterium]